MLLGTEPTASVTRCVLPSLLRNTIMPVKCCTKCARESSTLPGIKLHRQNCTKYHEYIATLRSLKKRAAEAKLDSREGTNTVSYYQRGEPETTQTVSVVMFPGPTEH
jgi:hypothetical protein